MKIEAGRKVLVEYTLYLDNPEGEILEETSQEEPFVFTFKEEAMLDEFERRLEGLSVGDKFSFAVKCEDAYGPELEEAVVEFAKSLFEVDGVVDEEAIAEGEVVDMEDDEGETHQGIVIETKDVSVVIDFNHPLAGCDLYFDGKVLEVSE